MTLPPKLITVLGLLQLFFIVAGFLITCTGLKAFEALSGHADGGRVLAGPGFVRSFGLWFVLIPIVWCVVAAFRCDPLDADPSISLPQFIIGISLTVIVAAMFTSSALSAVFINF